MLGKATKAWISATVAFAAVELTNRLGLTIPPELQAIICAAIAQQFTYWFPNAKTE